MAILADRRDTRSRGASGPRLRSRSRCQPGYERKHCGADERRGLWGAVHSSGAILSQVAQALSPQWTSQLCDDIVDDIPATLKHLHLILSINNKKKQRSKTFFCVVLKYFSINTDACGCVKGLAWPVVCLCGIERLPMAMLKAVRCVLAITAEGKIVSEVCQWQ